MNVKISVRVHEMVGYVVYKYIHYCQFISKFSIVREINKLRCIIKFRFILTKCKFA